MCQESLVKNAFSLMRWRLMAVVAVLLTAVGPLSALSAEAAGPATTWQATAGVSSPDQSVQSNFYFPNNITIDKGDSVTWTMKSGEFHTVTFLSGQPAPALVNFGPPASFNLAAILPSGPSTYTGTGIVSSGLLGVVVGTAFTLKFDSVGTYQYNCLVHTRMKGWVKVQPAGTPYPHTQSFYNSQAATAEAVSLTQGYAFAALGLVRAISAGAGHVTAGIGMLFSTGSLGIVRFLPQVDIIHVGQSVTWNNRDPEFPHTVTFNLDFPDPLGSFFPSLNVKPGPNGGSASIGSTSDQVNSGVLVAGGPFGTQFTVKFSQPGTYAYHCELHDQLGMTGTVVVLPGS